MRKRKARIPAPGARTRYVIGIDEVGRGPLAGPVTVAAVLVPSRFPFEPPCERARLRDSKRLSAERREAWFSFLTGSPAVSYAIASVSPARIDRVNITRAANAAATAAFRSLARRHREKVRQAAVVSDAGLHVDTKTIMESGVSGRVSSLVKGDERVQAVAFASILAKVTRDRLMERFHSRYPAYGFATHKGYGTPAHIRSIRAHGPCAIHRLTFIRRCGTMDADVRL
jgi:ribonuclease HII